MIQKLVIATLAVSLLAGCSTLKKVTGQQNDTVLPGQREDILPPDQQQARDPAITGQQASVPQTNDAVLPPADAPVVNPPPAQSAAADPNCDPNVDLCPEALPPEPLPPPSKPMPVEAKPKAKTMAKVDPKAKTMAKTDPKVADAMMKKKKKKLMVPKADDGTTPAVQ